MRRFVLAFSAAAILAPQSAAAQFRLAPDWAEKPTEEELAPGYPKLAQWVALEGNVRLRCDVAVTGVLEGCRVDHESPKGVGFGEAALNMSATFKMRPPLQPGARYPDTTVRIPVNFRLPSSPSRPAVPTLDERRAKLVDQLVAASDPADTWLAQARRGAERMKADPGPGIDDKTAAAAAEASIQAAERLAPQARRDLMAILASAFSPEELEAFAAFAASPVGKRYFAEPPERVAALDALRQQAVRSQRREARDALCAGLSCDVDLSEDRVAAPEGDLVPVNWSRRPTDAEQRASWPFASVFGVSLAALLDCGVGAQGRPEDCKVLLAEPAALGARKAALSLAELHRADPKALEAGAAGRRALLTMLVLGSAPRPSKPPAAQSAGRRLELARQVVAAQTDGAPPPAFKPEQLEKAFGQVEPSVRAAAEAALQTGYRRAADQYRLGVADRLALEFTETELRQVLEYHSGPGRALLRAQEAQRDELEAFGKAYSGLVADAAREIFCAAHDCKEEPPPPDPKPLGQPAGAKSEPSTRKP